MKKILLFAILLGSTVLITSCGSDECVCTDGTTITEDDITDGSLQSNCDAADALAKVGNASAGCSIE